MFPTIATRVYGVGLAASAVVAWFYQSGLGYGLGVVGGCMCAWRYFAAYEACKREK